MGSKKEEDKDKIKTKVPKNNDKVIYLGYYMIYNGHSMFVLNVEEDKKIFNIAIDLPISFRPEDVEYHL